MGGETTTPDCWGQPGDGSPKKKKIKSVSREAEDGESWLSLGFEDGTSDSITVESSDSDTQEEGQRELGQFLYSIGARPDDDVESFVGRTSFTQDGRYVPPPDDDMMEAA